MDSAAHVFLDNGYMSGFQLQEVVWHNNSAGRNLTRQLRRWNLNVKPITKSPFVVDINLHVHNLYFLACEVHLLLVLFILFQLRSRAEPTCCPVEYMHTNFNQRFIKNNIISTKSNWPAPVSNYHFNLPPIWFIHIPNMSCTLLWGGEMLKAIWVSSQRNLA
jgi:hypothetical protein